MSDRETNHNLVLNMTKEDFLKDLYRFMEDKGQPITKIPSLGYKELDLFHLYRLVVARGGMDEVTRKQEWKSVYQDLGIPTMSTSASYNTRTNYKKHLYLYELEHCEFGDQSEEVSGESSKSYKFSIGQYIRIVSEVYEGQVFYAQVVKCRVRGDRNAYYVHYNGWSSSHDEWMPEDVLGELLEHEASHPEALQNPPPSRSSKSNRIIEDPLLLPGERPLPVIGGTAGRETRKRKNTSDSSEFSNEDNGYDDDDDYDDNYGNTNDYDQERIDADQPSKLIQRRSDALVLRGGRGRSAVTSSLCSPLDRAPLTPDWDLIKQELLDAELEEDGPGQLTVRQYHIHHNTDTSVPVFPSEVDVKELDFMEENSFDLEPGKKLLEMRVDAIKRKINRKTSSYFVPEFQDDRSLEEIRASVEDIESKLIELEQQYKRNSRLLHKLTTAAHRGARDNKREQQQFELSSSASIATKDSSSNQTVNSGRPKRRV